VYARLVDMLHQASGGYPVLCSGKNMWPNIHRYIGRELLRTMAVRNKGRHAMWWFYWQ